MIETSTPNAAAAARALLAVRRGAPRLRALPAPLAPQTLADAYAVQYALLRELNSSIAGWKATLFDAENGICAPLPANAVRDAPAYLVPARMPTQNNSQFGIEPEVAFRLGSDLPPLRAGAHYDRDSVNAALVSAHAVFEVVVSRFLDPAAVSQLERVADSFMNELLIVGPSVPDWRSLPLATLPLEVRVDGKPMHQARGGHPLNDPLQPVVWLANHLSQFGQGLRAGEIVTTGSWNDVRQVTCGQSVTAWFDGLGSAIVSF